MSTNPAIHHDLFWLICDDEIGRGMSRVVYRSSVLKDFVIKVEDCAGKFQNVIEWETWKRVEGTEFEKWFAPCKWISPNGSVLVQQRTHHTDNYPARMPVFLADFKRANYGLIGKQIVCHDYGTNLLFERGMSKRMQKVEWWDD